MATIKGDITSRIATTNALSVGASVIATSLNGQLTLDKNSATVQTFTGIAQNFTVKLSNALAYPTTGYLYVIHNKTTQSINILNNSSTVLITIPAGFSIAVSLRNNSSSDGIWDIAAFSNASFTDNSTSLTATFNRSGAVGANTWLLLNGVLSSVTGFRSSVVSGTVVRLFTSTSATSTYTIGLYTHDGNLVNSVRIATLAVVSGISAESTPSLSLANGKQLAIKIESGSVSDVLASAIIKGSIT